MVQWIIQALQTVWQWFADLASHYLTSMMAQAFAHLPASFSVAFDTVVTYAEYANKFVPLDILCGLWLAYWLYGQVWFVIRVAVGIIQANV